MWAHIPGLRPKLGKKGVYTNQIDQEDGIMLLIVSCGTWYNYHHANFIIESLHLIYGFIGLQHSTFIGR